MQMQADERFCLFFYQERRSMMKCHKYEKAESIRLHCFLPVLASFLNPEGGEAKPGGVCPNRRGRIATRQLSKPRATRMPTDTGRVE